MAKVDIIAINIKMGVMNAKGAELPNKINVYAAKQKHTTSFIIIQFCHLKIEHSLKMKEKPLSYPVKLS